MADMVNSTWEDRDLPVLRAIVEKWDEGVNTVTPAGIAARTGLPEDVVQRALLALDREDPPFFTPVDGSTLVGKHISGVKEPTGHARRTVGTWPTPEALADRLVQALAQAADNEPDEEKRGWLKKTAAWFGSAGRDVAVDIASSVVTKSAGLG
ncbi:hypothetical protein HC028_23170 [Planosporangium flavigriseum]|uniref:Uncharacterized protein n=1 Tax=Planosporangium flavigriseum TaxID=373681 RepID=A0A8J3PN11_9ACTN|nr:hypothetical protein [Planosporangium flavigriseum]NJC67380.1 hypothetical protein [Planosporangium flavigriseum]GIG75467.1 hypothetical protein Pfl04_38710 [Planosporangium flavigriseum]